MRRSPSLYCGWLVGGVVGAGGGPEVVGTGGSGLEVGFIGSATGLSPAGVSGTSMLFACGALVDVAVPWRFVVVCFGWGAVGEVPVLEAVDPALVEPDVFEPELCACMATGAISATATMGSASLPEKLIVVPSCADVRAQEARRRCPQWRYSATV